MSNPALYNFCFETICVENRQIRNQSYHQARINRTQQALWGGIKTIDLGQITIPDHITKERHKLRISYDQHIQQITWQLHHPRPIGQVKKVYAQGIDYRYKYEDRRGLEALFALREQADEIIIVQDGLLTDSFYGNLVLGDGTTWHTPANCLLPGTQRAYLIDQGVITPQIIREEQIQSYPLLRIINALNDWEHAPTIPLQSVV
ncbi:4-amino-4-deoxychorismate lyase [Dyadobacter jejuensis]|uniref:4-amino-4-deoxychorismate lyase n=1 Tax=Dyadobacter jejuensis TaxID=1082580 RepID=A0A316AIX5_9BACT|nr:hypothetical protein [Dyadobacter jejuensis]PWJ57646.1 4-amino-4-deoxychorismate lyase [Dyadobacter jejuensis]